MTSSNIYRMMRQFASIIIMAALLMVFVMDTGYAQPDDKLFYSCSNQVYEAIDKQKIKAFTEATGIDVEVETGASIWAVVQVFRYESPDLASSVRSLYRRHQSRGLEEIAFCKDQLAVITRKGCGVENLTEKQVEDIFSGEIGNWKELGGEDLEITVVAPSKETGANKNFRRHFMKHHDIRCEVTTRSSTMATGVVEALPCGAISFIGRGAGIKNPRIRLLKIDGKSPDDPDYPYYQTFYYVTRSHPKGAAKQFIDFTFSDAGQKLLKENGLIPVKR